MPIENSSFVTPDEFEQKENETNSENLDDLVLQIHEFENEMRWIKAWVNDQTISDEEKEERREVYNELEDQIEVLSNAVSVMKNNPHRVSELIDEQRFRKAYRNFREMQDEDLEEYLKEKKEQHEAKYSLENRDVFETEEILPPKSFNPAHYSPREVVGATEVTLFELEEELGPDVEYVYELEELREYILSEKFLSLALEEHSQQVRKETDPESPGLDLAFVKEKLSQQSMNNSEHENLWEFFKDLTQNNERIIFSLIAKNTDLATGDIFAKYDLSKRASEPEQKELMQKLPNIFNIALRNSIAAMEYSRGKEEDKYQEIRENQQDLLKEFYGKLPRRLEYQAEEILKSIDIEKLVKDIEDEKQREVVRKSLEFIETTMNQLNSYDYQVKAKDIEQLVGEYDEDRPARNKEGKVELEGLLHALEVYLKNVADLGGTERVEEARKIVERTRGLLSDYFDTIDNLDARIKRKEEGDSGVVQKAKSTLEQLKGAIEFTFGGGDLERYIDDPEVEQERRLKLLKASHEILSFVNNNQDLVEVFSKTATPFDKGKDSERFQELKESIRQNNFQYLKKASRNIPSGKESEYRDYRGWDLEKLEEDDLDLVITDDPELAQKLSDTEFYGGEVDLKGANLKDSENLPKKLQGFISDESFEKKDMVKKYLKDHLTEWFRENSSSDEKPRKINSMMGLTEERFKELYHVEGGEILSNIHTNQIPIPPGVTKIIPEANFFSIENLDRNVFDLHRIPETLKTIKGEVWVHIPERSSSSPEEVLPPDVKIEGSLYISGWEYVDEKSRDKVLEEVSDEKRNWFEYALYLKENDQIEDLKGDPIKLDLK